MSDEIVPADTRTREQIVEELTEWYRARGTDGPRALAENNADKPLARLMGNAEPILARLMAGIRQPDVAREFGVSRTALNAWLVKHAPDQYREIAAGRSLQSIQDAEEVLEDPNSDKDQVSRARELGRLAGWTLERVSKVYAPPGKDGQGNGGVTINVIVDRSCDGSITIDNGQG